MNLQSDDFELLGVPRRYSQDTQELMRRWKALQAEVHPDRFVNASDAEKRLAMQWSARANQAYQRLKQPLSRARYLCELQGFQLGEEDNTAMPKQFLMQQLEWLEALDDAQSPADLEPIRKELEAELAQTIAATARALDDENSGTQAVGHIRSWMFLERFMQRINARQAQIGPA